MASMTSQLAALILPLGDLFRPLLDRISTLESLEYLPAVRLLRHRVTKRSSEPFKDAGAKQERLHLWWLSLEDNLGQIVQDIALIPTHLLKQFLRMSPVRQGRTQ